jgi:hypothetical protein
MKTVVVLLLFLIGSILLGSSLSLSSTSLSNNKNPPKQPSLFLDRRTALATALKLPTTILLLTLATTPNPALASIAKPPLRQGITTVILDSPDSKIGVQLYDVQIGSETFPAVKAVVLANGKAALQGVQKGMIVVSSSSSKAVVQRIQSGPYPLVFQFYNLAEEMTPPGASISMSAAQGLQVAQQTAAKTDKEEQQQPQLSSKGTGLVTKTVRKGTTTDCTHPARRGDTVTIAYEARVASPGGPVYDSSNGLASPVTFVLGGGKAISGVNIGIGGMCEREV